MRWLTPIIPATSEAKSGRIAVQAGLGKTLVSIRKITKAKRAAAVAQVTKYPEFKSQYCQREGEGGRERKRMKQWKGALLTVRLHWEE
jgi:hypothetical protein